MNVKDCWNLSIMTDFLWKICKNLLSNLKLNITHPVIWLGSAKHYKCSLLCMFVLKKPTEVHLHVDLKWVRTLIMASWQFDESLRKEEGSYNTHGEELLMWTYCRYRGLVTGTHGSLGPGVNQNAKCYCAPWQRAILSPAQDTILHEKLNHSRNRILLIYT